MERSGEKIQGSQYVRSFCCMCRAAIRTMQETGGALCSDCSPVEHGGIPANDANRTEGQLSGLKKTRS